jgi:hypothetical protein
MLSFAHQSVELTTLRHFMVPHDMSHALDPFGYKFQKWTIVRTDLYVSGLCESPCMSVENVREELHNVQPQAKSSRKRMTFSCCEHRFAYRYYASAPRKYSPDNAQRSAQASGRTPIGITGSKSDRSSLQQVWRLQHNSDIAHL